MRIEHEYMSGENEDGDDISAHLYEFHFPTKWFFGRIWDANPNTADLLHWTDSEGHLHTFPTVPYDDPDFRQVVRYFRDTKGMTEVGVWSREKRIGNRRPSDWIVVDFAKIESDE